MEVSEILMDRMDKYLEGAMSEEEIKAFESELQTNSELARAFEQHKETILTIESIGMKDEIAEVIRQNRNQSEKKARTVSFNRSAIAVAASLVILIGAFFFLKPSGTSSGLSLYSSLYQADPGLPTLMGATDNPIFSDAMVSYKEGKYQEALESFNVLSVANPGNDTLAFYQGICYLELNQTQESIQSFDQIDPSKPIWGNKAEWYKAMAWLKADQVQNAREILEQIAADNNHRYEKEAQSALERISE